MISYSQLDVFDFYNNLNLYNNIKKIDDINHINFHKNVLVNSNINNNNNYYNIIHSTNECKINQNIENNNKNNLEIKDNTKDLVIKIESQNISNESNNLSINKKKIKLKNKYSKYRGVTKNKKKWQVCFWMKGKNFYVGSYSSEILAAKIYDIIAIRKKGNKAKTNFKYNIKQINEISNINVNNIFEIIYKIIFD